MTEETIGRGMAKKQVLLALRRLAFYHATMVEVLKEELGEDQGRELARAVVARYGQKIGRAARARTDEQGLEPSALNYSEDLPRLGFDASRVSDVPLTSRVNGCPLAEYWREMGCEEDGAIYCGVDQAKYEAYNPELRCVHQVHCLRDGTDFCELVVDRRT